MCVCVCANTAEAPRPHASPLVWAQEGNSVTLACSESASTPPAITTWSRGAEGAAALAPSPKYTLSRDGATYSLTIANVSRDDVGTYFCRSENALALRRAEVYLSVTGELPRGGGGGGRSGMRTDPYPHLSFCLDAVLWRLSRQPPPTTRASSLASLSPCSSWAWRPSRPNCSSLTDIASASVTATARPSKMNPLQTELALPLEKVRKAFIAKLFQPPPPLPKISTF